MRIKLVEIEIGGGILVGTMKNENLQRAKL